MITRVFHLAALLCCLLIPVACATAQVKGDPAAMVHGIYNQLLDPNIPAPSDFELLRPLASDRLQDLLDREIACQEQGDETCKYGFSVIVDGQDFDLTNLAIDETLHQSDSAEVTASFHNFGEPKQVVFVFQKQGAGWVLEDVQSRDQSGWSLASILQ